MALQEGPPDLGGWAALASAAGLALATFVYYLKRGMGKPCVDPVTKAWMEGMKEDIERIEGTVAGQSADFKALARDLTDLKVKVASIPVKR